MNNNPAYELLDRVLNHGIKDNADAIASISRDSDVALLFFDVAEGALDDARNLGWQGAASEVRRMEQPEANRLARAFQRITGDASAAAWFRRRHSGRIFVVTGVGTLCVNHSPGSGVSIEPGTIAWPWAA
jgi:hypothetical protein